MSQKPPLPTNSMKIVIAATFTAEPLEELLHFWKSELELPAQVQFAPYNQVFQQLLDPASVLSQNRQGLNVVLVRLDDWIRQGLEVDSLLARDEIQRNAKDLVSALKSCTSSRTVPWLVSLCPASPAIVAKPACARFLQETEETLASDLAQVDGIYLLKSAEVQETSPVSDYYDPRTDQLGHIPYTPSFFAALASMIMCRFHAL